MKKSRRWDSFMIEQSQDEARKGRYGLGHAWPSGPMTCSERGLDRFCITSLKIFLRISLEGIHACMCFSWISSMGTTHQQAHTTSGSLHSRMKESSRERRIFFFREDTHKSFLGSSKGLQTLIELPFWHIKRVFFLHNIG